MAPRLTILCPAILGLIWGGTTNAHAQQPMWQPGPAKAAIGIDLAQIVVPDGYLYLDRAGTEALMELTENPLTGMEQATVTSADEESFWFLVFEWDEMGYVDDSEAQELDSDEIMRDIRRGTAEANKERKRRGWGTMSIAGWQEPPHYDPVTHNLTWSTIIESGGEQGTNRIVKLLGRRGVMTATLVSPVDELARATKEADQLLAGYSFRPGNTYAEFQPGSDRIAEIRLTALIAGGAGAALVKSGLLARLWKLVAAGLAAVAAGLGKFGKRIFGGGGGGLQEQRTV
jgi:uncharacterized membrane-anchored protein